MNSTFHIEFPATPEWFRTIRKLLITASVQCGFDDRSASQVAMAVDEAMCNIHRHGYDGRHDGYIDITVHTNLDPHPTIEIELNDEGIQVDIGTIQSRDLEDVRPGGIGVHLIQTIMDEAQWSHNTKGGMKLTMKKEYHLNQKQNSMNQEESNV